MCAPGVTRTTDRGLAICNSKAVPTARLGNTADFFGNRAKLQCPWRPSSSATVAADFRAPTPSAAAELIVPDINDLQRRIDGCTRALARQLLNRVRDAQQRLDHARETLQRCLAHKIDSYKRSLLHITRALQVRSPARELMMRRKRFADLHRRLVACPSRLLENAKHRFAQMEGILRVLGPDATLRRGYTITMNERGKKHSYNLGSPAKNENSHPCERWRIRLGNPLRN